MSDVKLSVTMVKPKNLLSQIKSSSDLGTYILESLKGIELTPKLDEKSNIITK